MKSKPEKQIDLPGKDDLDFNAKNDWNKLMKRQREGILKAIKQLDAGQAIPHKLVMRKYRKKYA